MQPPSACRTGLPGRRLLRGVDVERDHPFIFGQGFMKCRIIGKAKILSEPEDGGMHDDGAGPMRCFLQ